MNAVTTTDADIVHTLTSHAAKQQQELMTSYPFQKKLYFSVLPQVVEKSAYFVTFKK